MAKRRVGGTQSHPSEGTKQKTKSQHGMVEKLNPSKALVEISEGGPNRSYYVEFETYKDGAKRKSLPPSAFGHVWWSQTVHRSRRTGALESNFPSKTLNHSFL